MSLDETPDPAPPRLALHGISKSFGRVPVLRGIDFTLGPDEVLGLVGENGAGKSTLMNIIGGVVRADAGSMHFDGRPFVPRSPVDARNAGIAFVHQELTLFPNLTIAENLQLVTFPRRAGPWIDRRASQRRAAQILERVGLGRSPDDRVERLSTGERQLVEIARALNTDARLLILDEPTSSLGVAERDRLHRLVRDLRASGLSIVYISHELGDVLSECDRIAVLRDGAVVAAGPPSAFTVDTLVRHMVGREIQQLYPAPRRVAGGEAVLELHEVTAGAVRGITLTVHRGEVLGLFGLMGAGRSELAGTIFGAHMHSSGDILLDGELVTGPPAERIERGIAFVTEDRRLDGLCLEASLTENITLAGLRKLTRGPIGILNRVAIGQAVRETTNDVRLSGDVHPSTAVGRLSGGNQQKVVLGKWLLTRPRVLILDEPTRGIDVGAKTEIYRLLHRLADSGLALLVISSELEELTGICDRILVMSEGQLRGSFEASTFDRERLLRAALPASVT